MVAAMLAVAVLVPASPAQAAPTFKLPFPCNQVWSGQTRTNHSPQNAIDFNRSNDYGDPVVASRGGTVVHRGTLSGTGYGNLIIIDHGSGWRTYYAHLSGFAVSLNQSVSMGQRIGYVGSSGNSTGAHLHYEQRSGSSAVKVRFDGNLALYWGTRNYTSTNCGNPYTAKEVCGSNYSVIDSAALGSAGRVYLLWNGSNGYNCVVTLKESNIGSPTWTTAFLQPQGGTRSTDSGYFSYYAGPVKRYAPGTCVKWGGSTGGQSYESPYEHCGS
jgi:murein DD-endopeptidase MepM/ murein hydrolase activator NlpD